MLKVINQDNFFSNFKLDSDNDQKKKFMLKTKCPILDQDKIFSNLEKNFMKANNYLHKCKNNFQKIEKKDIEFIKQTVKCEITIAKTKYQFDLQNYYLRLFLCNTFNEIILLMKEIIKAMSNHYFNNTGFINYCKSNKKSHNYKSLNVYLFRHNKNRAEQIK
jgi:hypothetical protein